MPHVQVTAKELSIIMQALSVAAAQYDSDSKIEPMPERLREQFTKQAADARKLIENLEAIDDGD